MTLAVILVEMTMLSQGEQIPLLHDEKFLLFHRILTQLFLIAFVGAGVVALLANRNIIDRDGKFFRYYMNLASWIGIPYVIWGFINLFYRLFLN